MEIRPIDPGDFDAVRALLATSGWDHRAA